MIPAAENSLSLSDTFFVAENVNQRRTACLIEFGSHANFIKQFQSAQFGNVSRSEIRIGDDIGCRADTSTIVTIDKKLRASHTRNRYRKPNTKAGCLRVSLKLKQHKRLSLTNRGNVHPDISQVNLTCFIRMRARRPQECVG